MGPALGIHFREMSVLIKSSIKGVMKGTNSTVRFAEVSVLQRCPLRWPEPIYLCVGYIFESPFSAGMI